MKLITNSLEQTQELAAKIVKNILDNPRKTSDKAFVLALSGDLGAGKTTFTAGLAKGLGIKEKILSPTFVLMKRFGIPIGKRLSRKIQFKNLIHIDCYRIQKPAEILQIGFQKMVDNPKNIIVIEWADKIKKILPQYAILINFEFMSQAKRKITTQGFTL